MDLDRSRIYDGSPQSFYGFDGPLLPAKDLQVGDEVVCLASRLSGNYDHWQQKTNKNHGWVLIDGIVTDIKPSGERVVTLDDKQVEKWRKPIGAEREEQYVGGMGRHVNHIVAIKAREVE